MFLRNTFSLTLVLYLIISQKSWGASRPCVLAPTDAGVYDSFCLRAPVRSTERVLRGGSTERVLRGGSTEQDLPREKTLYFLPVKDQGALGTCASFAVGGIVEYFFRGIRGIGLKVSDAELTILANTHAGGECIADSGLVIGNVLKWVQKMGCVEEKRLTYSDYKDFIVSVNGLGTIEQVNQHKSRICFLEEDSTKSYNETMKQVPAADLYLYGNPEKDTTEYRVGECLSIRHGSFSQTKEITLHAILRSLNTGNPVITGVPVFENVGWHPETRCYDSGVIKMPSPHTPPHLEVTR